MADEIKEEISAANTFVAPVVAEPVVNPLVAGLNHAIEQLSKWPLGQTAARAALTNETIGFLKGLLPKG